MNTGFQTLTSPKTQGGNNFVGCGFNSPSLLREFGERAIMTEFHGNSKQ